MHIGIIDSIKQKVRKAHMNDKKGVIFDMDGTVWDSSANVAKAWTVKVHEAGYTDKVVTREDIQSVMGKPMDVIADTLFTYTDTAAPCMTAFLRPGQSSRRWAITYTS